MTELRAQGGHPLTEAQTGIWLGQQLDLKSPLYNAAEAIEIFGPLSKDRFQDALLTTISEAPAVTAVFKKTDKGPRQYLQNQDLHFFYKDFSRDQNPQELAWQWMRQDLSSVVDLEQGPLYSQALIKVGDQHHFWYQRIHHIACDGFGFALLSQRLAEIYNHDIGKPFADYFKVLDEDRKYGESQARAESKQFWQKQLSGMLNPVSLSVSQAVISTAAVRRTVFIDGGKVKSLQSLAASYQCSWSDCLLAAVLFQVFRQTASREVTLGIPVMGRIGSASLRVPAMVMNIIPLRIKLACTTDFKTLLQQVSVQFRQTIPHQRYRYEQLRRDMNAVGGSKRLFGPVVNIMPFDRSLLFNDKPATVHNLSAGPVEDLSYAFVSLPDGGLRFDIEGNPGRYQSEQLNNYQIELVQLIDKLIGNPQTQLKVNIDAVSWLDGGPMPHTVVPVIELIRLQFEKNPGAIAVIDDEKQVTYADLYIKSQQAACFLHSQGVEAGDLVALVLPRGEQAIVLNIALLMLGATYLFIDPQGPETRNDLILHDAKPVLLIHHNDPWVSYFYRGKHLNISNLDQQIDRFAADHISIMHSAENQDKAAYVIYTSGSTGKPKGVIISHRSLAEFISAATFAYQIKRTDRILQCAPLHVDASVEEIFLALCNGATLLIRNDVMLDSIDSFLETCNYWKISVLDLPTAYWHELVYYCASTKHKLPESINTVIIGGEAALEERVSDWHKICSEKVRLLNTYGPSEATVVATYARLEKESVLSIGRPLAGRQAAIVDKDLNIVPRGREGELLLLGAGLGLGYLRLAEITAERFVMLECPVTTKPVRAYRSGDRARVDKNGNIIFLGRIDEEIKISGYRINLLEIESAILSVTGAEEVAVIATGLQSSRKNLAAFIVSEKKIQVKELRRQLGTALPAPMLPTIVKNLDSLPKNQSGKIDKRKLLELVKSDETTSPTDKAGNSNEQLIINTWRQILGITDIAVDDDFFQLGGQSLQTIQVANRLTAELGQTIAVTTLFQYPTAGSLARAISFDDKSLPVTDIRQVVEQDCILPEQRLPVIRRTVTEKQSCKNILLTGATGFVGTQLLCQLLKRSDTTVICLLRADTQQQAMQRIETAITRQGLALSKNELQKIEAVPANIEKPQLGLADELFAELSNRAGIIVHNAAITSVMRDYQSLRQANVLSTRELLYMAADNTVPVHFISSIAVAPDHLAEDYVDWHDQLRDGYQQSKWASEQLLAAAADRGYPVYIYRLPRVSGDDESGFINEKDLAWSIIRSSIRNEIYPDLMISEPWLPVNIAAQSLSTLVLQDDKPQQPVYNCCPDDVVGLPQLFIWLKEYGFKLKKVSIEQWCSLLEDSGNPEDRTILSFFQQQNGSRPVMPSSDNQNFKRCLQIHNINLPLFDRQAFYRQVDYAIKHGLLRSAAKTKQLIRGHYEQV